MTLNEQIDRIKKLSGIIESMGNTVMAFHGTRTFIPFPTFDPRMIGSGFVSSGTKFPGFFFTSLLENAEYYTEYFASKVKITDVKPNPLHEKHPPTVLKQAAQDNQIYYVEDYLDGAIHSDITVVPINRLKNVEIIEWIFIGDEESLFEKYDEFFGGEPEEETGEVYVTQSIIDQMLHMIELDENYLLTIPVFRKYYESKD